MLAEEQVQATLDAAPLCFAQHLCSIYIGSNRGRNTVEVEAILVAQTGSLWLALQNRVLELEAQLAIGAANPARRPMPGTRGGGLLSGATDPAAAAAQGLQRLQLTSVLTQRPKSEPFQEMQLEVAEEDDMEQARGSLSGPCRQTASSANAPGSAPDEAAASQALAQRVDGTSFCSNSAAGAGRSGRRCEQFEAWPR